jgi:hypothetical protein
VFDKDEIKAVIGLFAGAVVIWIVGWLAIIFGVLYIIHHA